MQEKEQVKTLKEHILSLYEKSGTLTQCIAGLVKKYGEMDSEAKEVLLSSVFLNDELLQTIVQAFLPASDDNTCYCRNDSGADRNDI